MPCMAPTKEIISVTWLFKSVQYLQKYSESFSLVIREENVFITWLPFIHIPPLEGYNLTLQKIALPKI